MLRGSRARSPRRRFVNHSDSLARDEQPTTRLRGPVCSRGRMLRDADGFSLDGNEFSEFPTLAFSAEHPVQSFRRLIDKRLRPMVERMEVFKRQIAAVADLVKSFQHGRPVGRPVQQWAK